MPAFHETLRSQRVLLMDGAMGTELQKAGLPEGACYEMWNLTHPDTVRNIHRAYLAAGARCLVTNTFQANPTALARHGAQDRLEEICAAGIDLARAAGTQDHLVLASIGPVPASEKGALRRCARACAAADALLLETWCQPSVLVEFLPE